MPYEGSGGVMYKAELGCVGWAKKKRESFNIGSGLQRTAEGLECFQMALQYRNRLQQADEPIPVCPSLSQPATCRDQSTERECTERAFNSE